MQYESLPIDFDMDKNLPTFYFPPDFPNSLDLDLAPCNGGMAGVNEVGKTNNTGMFTDQCGNGPQPTFAAFPPARSQQNDTRPVHLAQTSEATTGTNSPSDPPSSPPPVDSSTSRLSSTACFHKLTNLNVKILRSSEKSRSTSDRCKSPAGRGNQIVKDMVQFSGELIDIASQIMPHFFSASSSSVDVSKTSEMDIELEDTIEVDPALQSTPRHPSQGSPTDHDWASLERQSQGHSMPESAVIFLLLGCYTQILHSFETAINCLYLHHSPPARSSNCNRKSTLGTVNSLLEASLDIHTVTYLLNRLHRAFAIYKPGCSDDMKMNDVLHDNDTHLSLLEGWKTPFLGGRTLCEGLVGRAFDEIKEREQCLMRKTLYLKRIINKTQS
jgi:hypothetical protein